MPTIADAASDFLAQGRIGVAGVSRNPSGHGSNAVYQRFKLRGYHVYPVNPHADEVEGDPCYHDLGDIPGGVDAVVIGTRPERATAIVERCAQLGIERVWMHRSLGEGSVSDEAAQRGRSLGLTVIDGGCPLMFEPTDDFGHRCMKWIITRTGKMPTSV